MTGVRDQRRQRRSGVTERALFDAIHGLLHECLTAPRNARDLHAFTKLACIVILRHDRATQAKTPTAHANAHDKVAGCVQVLEKTALMSGRRSVSARAIASNGLRVRGDARSLGRNAQATGGATPSTDGTKARIGRSRRHETNGHYTA